MLLIHSRSLDFNGVSKIDDVAVASLHASYSANSDMYFSMNISNIELYAAHKELVDADVADFCAEVVAVISATKEEAGVEEAE